MKSSAKNITLTSVDDLFSLSYALGWSDRRTSFLLRLVVLSQEKALREQCFFQRNSPYSE